MDEPTNGGDLGAVPTAALWAELERRGAAVHAGWGYPAMASNRDANALISQFGYEFGPWQLLEKGEKLAKPDTAWRLMAEVPDRFRPFPGPELCAVCGPCHDCPHCDGSEPADIAELPICPIHDRAHNERTQADG